jgi:aminoglycoside 3-N-acetyltransferase
MYSRQQLTDGFRALGVRPGDVVMLHASIRAVGEVAGGPDQIHVALKDALTSDGTLMMYASCPAYYDEVGRGHLSREQERELLEKLPAFDAQTARSQRENGALVELLRTYPGSIVNDHVARFVAWGKHAEALLAAQPWDYAFGRDSALHRFLELDGRILLLGSDHDNVTFFHYAEHVVDVPGKRIAAYQVPILEDGVRVWREMKEVDTSGAGAHPNWPDRFFARLTDTYLEQARNIGGRVGDARAFLVDARGLLEFTLPVMRAVAADPAAAGTLLPAPSPVEGPAPSPVEGPAPSPVEGPALSPVQGPALSPVQGPALSPVQGPAPSPVEGPAASSVEGPAPSSVERPAPSSVERPA